MTVNIEALLHYLCKGYSEIVDAELIPYKTNPKGAFGSPVIILEMAKEGLSLAFKREGRILIEITMNIQHEKVNGWEFPNELPSPLQKTMSRQWVHETFGEPERSVPPKVIMKKAFGWVELFTVERFALPLSMQFDYDLMDRVKEVAFIPTSELRW